MGIEWKDMLVFGGRVSARWQERAWRRMRRIDEIEASLARVGPIPELDAPYPDDIPAAWYRSEIANRMRQRARRLGVIEYTGVPKKWRFCEEQ